MGLARRDVLPVRVPSKSMEAVDLLHDGVGMFAEAPTHILLLNDLSLMT